MNKKKALVIPLAALALVILGIPNSYAQEIEKGPNYDREFVGFTSTGELMYTTTFGVPERILDNGIYKDYILNNTANNVRLETANAGSIDFNKLTCSYDVYDAGKISGSGQPPKIKNISWMLKGKANNTSTWANINSINNAACSVQVSSTPSTVKITASKQNTAGTFQIVLDYTPGHGIKETLRGFNNNPAWTNHNIGFVETFEVPRVIHFGQNTYDLSYYNGTNLNRNWIEANQAKIIKLTTHAFYDIGIGYDYLDTINISYVNNKPTLAFNYLFGGQIVPYQQWFEVDPTFGYTAGTNFTASSTAGLNTCDAPYSTRADLDIWLRGTGSAADPTCYNRAFKWDITSIPDYSIITSATVRYDITGVSTPRNCAWRTMEINPSTATATQLWNDILDGNLMVANSSQCTTVANDKVLSMGTNGTAYFQNQLASNWGAIGVSMAATARDAGNDLISFSATTELQLNYTTKQTDVVTGLTYTHIGENDVDLSWTAPTVNGGHITGYQLNITTPWANPQTVITNNTGTNGTTYSVSGLSSLTDYSFRVAAWKDGQISGNNVTGGKILNITTTNFTPANFTIGDINVNSTNPDIWPIRFVRTDTNSTYSTLQVIYDNTFDMNCNFDFVLARDNQTYYNITPSVYDSDHNYTNFNFRDYSDDVIHANCWDQLTNETGTYTYQQSNFPLLDQINNFRNGTYGTNGKIGSLDIITLAIVMFSMVGFNRVNESVGAVINIALLGSLSYFGIISLPGLIFSGLALVIMLAIITTRKD